MENILLNHLPHSHLTNCNYKTKIFLLKKGRLKNATD
nr:MAG TPA: hypothetical protein [Caudoviricetes sp.]